ncbi:uncharacterized protein F4807DRAFT_118588 [Annulohypoxylon truncatum]|uniref:uncharacterized protein n=1 Tax=Annulohypoxylon truncatum TaxID=327061 RepID=UPI002008D79E|nr:uncharacterized protein F4807DRAFT_118588 [Annulohypoxylon truncatum]KAI1214237.1 hypothetical protein F4807DRAFT_118588 [Annulohypoxylon truncatum]
MTSRFVSGGTIAGDGQTEPVPKQTSPLSSTTAIAKIETAQWGSEPGGEPPKRNTEWEAVQRELEADRRRREEARRAQVEGGAGGERSLFEVLQANKAAKQAAFEEQNRIRNQFRALDDDEIEFLEGVRDERREEEERVKRETEERLARFREAQKKSVSGPSVSADGGDDGEGEVVADDAKNDDGGVGVEDPVGWAGVGKKRKRDKESKSIVKGVKRRVSVHEKDPKATAVTETVKTRDEGKVKTTPATNTNPEAKSSTTANQTKPPALKADQEKAKPSLGLVDYGSDDDDDD